MSVVASPWLELLEGAELAHLSVEPPRAGRTEQFPDDLDPRVASALVAQGITGLYTHQAETWEALRAGGNAIVTTSTASGKSLAFNLPVLDLLAREPKSRALYLYPTKALAQDQARALGEFGVKGIKPAIYDGDTETERRWQIRKWANVVLTNPDMLHVGVLPHHDRWGDVLANLRYVVVDEAHVYRGVFGSHVANVLRRLRRLARAYDSEPQFVLASATIANAAQLAESLLGEPATVIDSDAAPRTERTIALWNPELIDAELGVRASSLGDASRLLASFVERDLRTICFAKSRKAVELIHRFASDRVDAEDRCQARPVPRRLHAVAAPRDRAAPDVRRAARRHRHRRARARDRHRHPRLRDLGRLPGHRVVAPAAVGPGGSSQPRPRRPRRERGRARPVLHARARDVARPDGRGGNPRPREPARSGRPCPLGRVRRPDRRGGRPDARAGSARARRVAARAEAHRRGLGLGRKGLSGSARAPALRRDRLVHRRRCRDGNGARKRRALARLLHDPRRRRLPPPRRAVPREAARRRRARGPRHAAPTSTGTRRRRRRPRPRSSSRCARRAGSASSSSSAASR